MPNDLRANFISNLALADVSGGWSGINVALYDELSKHFAINFVGPINPPSDYPAKVVSKLNRVNGNPGSFHFFSARRLKKVAEMVQQQVDESADCDFFHGSTPWIMYDSPRPYFLYVDTCFDTYIDVYHERSKFRTDDLKRICELEAKWLTQANQVFFGTSWARDRAAEAYQISSANLAVVGAGGSMTPPIKDLYQGGHSFLFVSLDFVRKGGQVCAEAFKRVQERHPDAQLTFVGQKPPAEILNMHGVSYAGRLRKSVASEARRLHTLYAEAFALVHPTTSDIQPLVISEAGYFGCPSIAAKNFGIPELIDDGVTGFLVDAPLKAEVVAQRMLELYENEARYLEMRRAVRRYSTENMTWRVIGNRIANLIESDLKTQKLLDLPVAVSK